MDKRIASDLGRGQTWEIGGQLGGPEHNGMGVFFLARHLVSLDFPEHAHVF